jgi:hypothetical protein
VSCLRWLSGSAYRAGGRLFPNAVASSAPVVWAVAEVAHLAEVFHTNALHTDGSLRSVARACAASLISFSQQRGGVSEGDIHGS